MGRVSSYVHSFSVTWFVSKLMHDLGDDERCAVIGVNIELYFHVQSLSRGGGSVMTIKVCAHRRSLWC